jgi:hypothetical protein
MKKIYMYCLSRRPARPHSVLMRALIFICCGLLSATTAFAQDHPKGESFEIKLTLNQILGEFEAARYAKLMSPDKRITWEVYLPDNDASEPPGVLVYVSPTNRGRILGRWREVMDQQNLIYIGARNSGNRILVTRRMVMALMSLKVLELHHLVDSSRISVSGFSGGGRVASMLAVQYPEVFSGAVYICGVNPWQESLSPRVDELVQNRFVFLTGSKDFNRDETRGVYQHYLDAGAQNSKLMIIPGMGHERPDKANMAEALEFLYGKAETEEDTINEGSLGLP